MISLDQVAGRLMADSPSTPDPNFTPEQTIVDRQLTLVDSAEELSVIIPPWHASKRLQQTLVRRQVRMGRTTLSYALHDDILTANPHQTIDCFEQVADQVAEDVGTAAEGISNVRYIASSLGCAVLLYAMGERKLTGRISLLAPGGDLARSLWTGSRTQHLKQAYEQQEVDLPQLQSLWERLAPTYQASHNIRNSQVTMYVSTADRVIPPDTVPPLAAALAENGNRVAVHTNRTLGHYATIVGHSLLNNQL